MYSYHKADAIFFPALPYLGDMDEDHEEIELGITWRKECRMIKKEIFCKYLLFVLLVTAMALLLYSCRNKYISRSEIPGYVVDNVQQLTQFSQDLLERQEENVEIYYKQDELPEGVNADFYSSLKITYVCAEVQFGNNEIDAVWIRLKYKPQDDEAETCGICYSPYDMIIDPYDELQPGDTYEYKGRARMFFKVERICENWFYYEEAYW